MIEWNSCAKYSHDFSLIQSSRGNLNHFAQLRSRPSIKAYLVCVCVLFIIICGKFICIWLLLINYKLELTLWSASVKLIINIIIFYWNIIWNYHMKYGNGICSPTASLLASWFITTYFRWDADECISFARNWSRSTANQ